MKNPIETLRALISGFCDAETAEPITMLDILDLYDWAKMHAAKEKLEKPREKPAKDINVPAKAPAVRPEAAASTEIAASSGFVGKGGADKKRIYERLRAYRDRVGVGAYRTLAELSNGSLRPETVRSMAMAEKNAYAAWLALEKVLDIAEQQERESAPAEQEDSHGADES